MIIAELNKIKMKNEDLEARSRRNNIRILGLPEMTAMGKPKVYIEIMLCDIFGLEMLSPFLVVKRAHRRLAPRPIMGHGT